MLSGVADRVFDDDRPTVDLGPRPPDEPDDEPLDSDADDSDIDPTHSLPPAAGEPGTVQYEYPGKPVDPVHALPTQQIPGKRRSGTGSMTRMSESRITASPVEAMRLDEIQRTRVFLRVAIGICVGGTVVALSTSGDAIAQRVVIIGSLLGVIGALWILRIARNEDSYAQRQVVLPALLHGRGSMSGVYYWGVASPVAAMLVYGIYFFSLGSSRRRHRGACTCSSRRSTAGSGSGSSAACWSTAAVISMSGLRTRDQLAVVGIIEFLYFIAFYHGADQPAGHARGDVRRSSRRCAAWPSARPCWPRRAPSSTAPSRSAGRGGSPSRWSARSSSAMLIGRGGMGEVYEAHGVDDRREAAVKLLHARHAGRPDHVAAVPARGADRRAARLRRTSSSVLEVGTTDGRGAVPRDGAAARPRPRPPAAPPAPDRAAGGSSSPSQVAQGLEAARGAGIVHRDLKPHNMFLAEAERRPPVWKILDFGVCKSRRPRGR